MRQREREGLKVWALGVWGGAAWLMHREAAEEKEQQTLSLREGRRGGRGEKETW